MMNYNLRYYVIYKGIRAVKIILGSLRKKYFLGVGCTLSACRFLEIIKVLGNVDLLAGLLNLVIKLALNRM